VGKALTAGDVTNGKNISSLFFDSTPQMVSVAVKKEFCTKVISTALRPRHPKQQWRFYIYLAGNFHQEELLPCCRDAKKS